MRACLRRNRPGPYQIQAAISAVHSDAPIADGTDWSQIVQLYDQLLVVGADARRRPEPRDRGRRGAGTRGAGSPSSTARPRRVPPVPRDAADLLERTGRRSDAITAYDTALTLVTNRAEAQLLQRRRDAID